jgi:hypothetical protein
VYARKEYVLNRKEKQWEQREHQERRGRYEYGARTGGVGRRGRREQDWEKC